MSIVREQFSSYCTTRRVSASASQKHASTLNQLSHSPC
jgi:hypothetical protein